MGRRSGEASGGLTRRQALKTIGAAGLGVAAGACGGGGGGGGGRANPTPTQTPPAPTPTASPVATAVATGTFTPPPSLTPTASRTPTDTPTDSPTDTPTAAPSATPTATFRPDCVLTPQQTEGPFFFDAGLLRRDVREDRQGVPLRLVLQLVDVGSGCAPIRDALLDIWHTDAAGLYSGYPGQPGGIDTSGQTFLRGYQLSDASGRVEFLTIYPGWYPGRTVHIHVKARVGASALVTSQLYFDDALTDRVHLQPPYDLRGRRNTTNATDAIARAGIADLTLHLAEEGAGYVGSLVIGVR